MKTTTTTTTALRLLAVLFIFCLFAPMAIGQDASTPPTYWEGNVDKIANAGDGNGESWKSPILIASAEELAYLAKQVNAGNSLVVGSGSIENEGDHIGFKGYYFALSADIDLEKHYWTPIGTYDNPFKGNFDGQGHCVSGLKVNVNGNNNVYTGLFGRAYIGTIQNLGVCVAKEGMRGAVNEGSIYAGGIAGSAQNVHNCYVVGEGSIEINVGSVGFAEIFVYAGGIVGDLSNSGSLTNCYATVDIRIETNGERYAGGIVGFCNSNSTISYTYATGDIETGTGEKEYYAGGICGYLKGSTNNTTSTIKNSLALNGRITGGDNKSNRIVGKKETEATLTTNYASPEIVVNGNTVSDGTGSNENGDPSITFNNFQDKLKVEWEAAWTFSSDGYLPQLMLNNGDGTYTDWPEASPQPFIDAVASLPGSIANTGNGDGSGWNKAILIANRAELAYFAQQVNKGEAIKYGSGSDHIGPGDNNFEGFYFALSADIDLEKHYWTPIGIGSNSFKGNFDGQGHCVSGLKVNVNGNYNVYAGLFGSTYLGTIQNLGVRLAKEGVRGTVNQRAIYAGGIAGQALNVHNCYVVGEGSIEITGEGDGYAGGIVGYLFDSGSLTNCYATVDIKIENNRERYAGGIVGYCNFNSTISCTYATGDVDAGTGDLKFYAGGICGYLSGATSNYGSTIEKSLALNGRIAGGSSFSNRIVGHKETHAILSTNYASPVILVNDKTSTDNLVDNENGANTWLSSFQDDLKSVSRGANGWAESWDFSANNLPQLKKKTADGYEAWGSKQPPLKANLYLPSRLYIVSPIGGTLTVTDKADNPLTDGSAVMSGTQLNLTYAESGNYHFSEYLSGSDKGSLKSYDSNSITMPDADLYLSATFTYQEPTPPYVPPVPIYYSVYLPQVEGASTDPGPGEHEVESWDDFRFYLTLDSAYSESQPVVTTDRGETLEPRSSDGAYLVKYVRSDVEVFIDGLIQNPPPVANEAIGTDALVPQIWSEGSMLCIRMPEALPSTPVSIYTTDGRLHTNFASTPGLNRRQLPTGIYIVRVGETVRKVAIRK